MKFVSPTISAAGHEAVRNGARKWSSWSPATKNATPAVSWANSHRRFDVAYGIRRADDLAAVVAFFEARKARLHGFRTKDWADYKSCLSSQAVAAATAGDKIRSWHAKIVRQAPSLGPAEGSHQTFG